MNEEIEVRDDPQKDGTPDSAPDITDAEQGTADSAETNAEVTGADCPTEFGDEPRFVYHWRADDRNGGTGQNRSGTITFVIVTLTAFALSLATLLIVLFALPQSGDEGSDKHIYVHDRDDDAVTLTVQEIADACNPYTVAIASRSAGAQSAKGKVGTGVIVSEDGYVITNYHVVEDASSVTVYTYGGGTFSADVAGYDEVRDVAVLKLRNLGGDGLTAAVIADGRNVMTGDKVVAIGTPESLNYAWSVTVGYVSCNERNVTSDDGSRQTLIQFDAAVNPGNSGGPLINDRGEVIGIVQLKLDDSDGIGFAIPIGTVMEVYESIVPSGN